MEKWTCVFQLEWNKWIEFILTCSPYTRKIIIINREPRKLKWDSLLYKKKHACCLSFVFYEYIYIELKDIFAYCTILEIDYETCLFLSIYWDKMFVMFVKSQSLSRQVDARIWSFLAIYERRPFYYFFATLLLYNIYLF